MKIHDNDMTSFDAWINGTWRREAPKQKGITGLACEWRRKDSDVR
jgi:hypothetical protein